MDWWSDHASLVWIIAALVLGGIEITTLDLSFLMLAVGALAGALTAGFTDQVLVQAVVAAVTAVAMLGFVRPVALRHLRVPTAIRTGVDALVGRQALVTERVDRHDGRIRLGGEIWTARPYDPDQVIASGATVDVVRIEGATAIVLAVDQP